MHEYLAATEGHMLHKSEQKTWFRAIAWQIHWAHAKRAMKPEKFWPITTDDLSGNKEVNMDLFHRHYQWKAQDIINRNFNRYQKHLIGSVA
jgi:hypothetical protein